MKNSICAIFYFLYTGTLSVWFSADTKDSAWPDVVIQPLEAAILSKALLRLS